jgi:hypothetical protein
VPWATAWLREAAYHLGRRDIQVVKARRTRAHFLQLHGFLEVAALELDAARRAVGATRAEAEYRSAELVDLLLRTSVDVAEGSVSTLDEGRGRLHQVFDQEPNPGLMPGLLRNKLQLASIQDAANRKRRTFGDRKASAYDSAVAELMAVLERSPAPARYAMWDSLIAAAIRVGDTDTVQQAADAVVLLPTNGPVNSLDQLRLRLALAARLPGLGEIRDLKFFVPDHPLRRRDLLPRRNRAPRVIVDTGHSEHRGVRACRRADGTGDAENVGVIRSGLVC